MARRCGDFAVSSPQSERIIIRLFSASDTFEALEIPPAHTLPDAITFEKVSRLIEATCPLRNTYVWTVYSFGLRLAEGLHLQISEHRQHAQLVHVHRGKGVKDRYAPPP